MARSVIVLCFIWLTVGQAVGQSLTLYNLRNEVAQNHRFNPAFIPNGKTIVGLPVISGVSVGLNSATNYNTLISRNEEGQLIVDFDRMIENLDEKSFYYSNTTISDLYLGFNTPNGFLSIFVNERMEANAFTPKSMVQLAWEGNHDYAGRTYNFERFRVDFKYYRELGIGLARPINNQLTVGGRIKMVQGVIAGRSDRRFSTRTRFADNTYNLSFLSNNARYDMAGEDAIQNASHWINNPSKGFALDLGFEYRMSDLAFLSFGLNDVGYIRWKANPENFELLNSEFEWVGLELQTIEDLGEQVKDSLKAKFDRVETEDAFTTGLNTRSYLSLFLHPTYQDVVSITLANRFVNGKILTTFGAGISHHFGKRLTLGATTAVTSQQGVDFGAAMSTNFGPVQFYMSYDHLLGLTNVTKLDVAQFNFGINLVFGRSLKKSKDPRQAIIDRNNAAHPNYPATRNTYTPVIREEGIYQIIREKKEPEIYEARPHGGDFNADADEKQRRKPIKQKRRSGDFNKRSDERGIERFAFWKTWFNKN